MRGAVAGWLVLVGLAGQDAQAKDETPRPHELALAHPRHPRGPSTSTLELRCGERVQRFVLAVDDRGWRHLRAPGLEALELPGRRFLKEGEGWKPLDEASWVMPRVEGLSLRELSGGPVLPSSWSIEQVSPPGAQVEVRVRVGQARRTLVFDAVLSAWTEERDERGALLRVRESTVFAGQHLPKTTELRGGCVLTASYATGSGNMPEPPPVEERR